ncbi:di-heme oxidoredictase family protein [Rugamonas sp. CCM 8940]|uniref:di-heme oxidoredictase family protein n=1 Tax=Rugamonas sp. CCM 8940 TaxID=2765359 RepID=UPI001F3D665A|nr:di-heme oxidoredictase family protein [Rugamonas sp. CCM 8940]
MRHLASLTLLALAACAGGTAAFASASASSSASASASAAGPTTLSAAASEPPSLVTGNTTREAFAQPLAQLPPALRESFQRGRSLFRQNWVIAPAADAQVDGLGPFYNRISCIACHSANGKGHAPDGPNERAGALLVRLSVPGVDDHGGPKPHPVYGDQFREASIPGVPAPGRVSIAWPARLARTVTLAGGAKVRLRAPQIRFHELAYGPLQRPLTSARVGPVVFGLGLLAAVPDAPCVRIVVASSDFS